jgi:hypothetical protein
MKAAEEWNKEMEDEDTKEMIPCCIADSLNVFAFNPPHHTRRPSCSHLTWKKKTMN